MAQFYIRFTWHGSPATLESYAKKQMSALKWGFVSTSLDSGLSPFSNVAFKEHSDDVERWIGHCVPIHLCAGPA